MIDTDVPNDSSQAQDSARKVSELQQNESFLRGRVEELEMTENMLRETLQQADLILAQRERKLRDQVCLCMSLVCTKPDSTKFLL